MVFGTNIAIVVCSYRGVRDKYFSGTSHAIVVTRGRSHAIVW